MRDSLLFGLLRKQEQPWCVDCIVWTVCAWAKRGVVAVYR